MQLGSYFCTFQIAEWSARCEELFPYSTYFKGAKSSATLGVAVTNDSKHSENGEVESDSVRKETLTDSVNGGVRDLVLS